MMVLLMEILYSRLKDFDQEDRLLGMLPHNNQFISNDLDIKRQLSISTNIVKGFI
ncbi:Uncharacterised protein [Staphylococcus gallinarum]|uniref:Uncharacterized protein n=1 Tax=Staphylococcus gallinarum TaxID=1293 RepID=A0A380FF21_STAGA|nr:Uncharacterised protein [Staphylococcus gallinarum]